jgi:hypothetical protein
VNPPQFAESARRHGYRVFYAPRGGRRQEVLGEAYLRRGSTRRKRSAGRQEHKDMVRVSRERHAKSRNCTAMARHHLDHTGTHPLWSQKSAEIRWARTCAPDRHRAESRSEASHDDHDNLGEPPFRRRSKAAFCWHPLTRVARSGWRGDLLTVPLTPALPRSDRRRGGDPCFTVAKLIAPAHRSSRTGSARRDPLPRAAPGRSYELFS